MPGPEDWFSQFANSLQAEWSKIGSSPAPEPRTPRYAEISSGAPPTTGTAGPRPEVATPMAGHTRTGNGTPLVVDSHSYGTLADEKTRAAIRFLTGGQ